MAVIITIVDFVLINTVIPFEMMRNIPAGHIVRIAYESKFLSFIRCYGLASNPAASSTIIVALLAGLYTQQSTDFKDYHILVAILPLICLGSGTGFLLYIFFLFVRYKLYMFNKLKFILGIISILVFYFILTKHYIQKGLLDRLDINYFERLLHLKTEQITNVYKLLNHSLFETIFGFNYTKTMTLRVASDFGWVDLLECYGFFGVSLFVLYLILKKKIAYLPILIFVLGYFHYTAIGSIPGQILFATILLYKSNDNNESIVSQIK